MLPVSAIEIFTLAKIHLNSYPISTVISLHEEVSCLACYVKWKGPNSILMRTSEKYPYSPAFPLHKDLRPSFLPFLWCNLNELQRLLEEVSEKKPEAKACWNHISKSSSLSSIISASKSHGYMPALNLCDDLSKPTMFTWKLGRWVLGLQIIPWPKEFIRNKETVSKSYPSMIRAHLDLPPIASTFKYLNY